MMHIFETLKVITQAFYVHSLLLQMTNMAHFDIKKQRKQLLQPCKAWQFFFLPEFYPSKIDVYFLLVKINTQNSYSNNLIYVLKSQLFSKLSIRGTVYRIASIGYIYKFTVNFGETLQLTHIWMESIKLTVFTYFHR